MDRFLVDFWAQVGGQVGAKLGRKFEKWRLQDDVKKCVVQNERNCTQVYVSGRKLGGGVPYNQSIKHSQDNTMGIRTLPSGTRPGGGHVCTKFNARLCLETRDEFWKHAMHSGNVRCFLQHTIVFLVFCFCLGNEVQVAV